MLPVRSGEESDERSWRRCCKSRGCIATCHALDINHVGHKRTLASSGGYYLEKNLPSNTSGTARWGIPAWSSFVTTSTTMLPLYQSKRTLSAETFSYNLLWTLKVHSLNLSTGLDNSKSPWKFQTWASKDSWTNFGMKRWPNFWQHLRLQPQNREKKHWKIENFIEILPT